MSLNQAARRILDYVHFEPANSVQLMVEIVAAGLAATVTLLILGRLFQGYRTSFGASLLVVAVGGLTSLYLGAAAMTYFPDLIGKDPTVELVVLYFGLTALLIVAPFLRMMWRCSYGSALASYFLAALVGAAFVYIVNTSFHAISAGRSQVNKGIQHNRQTERILDTP